MQVADFFEGLLGGVDLVNTPLNHYLHHAISGGSTPKYVTVTPTPQQPTSPTHLPLTTLATSTAPDWRVLFWGVFYGVAIFITRAPTKPPAPAATHARTDGSPRGRDFGQARGPRWV